MRLADVDLEDLAVVDAWHVPVSGALERTLSGGAVLWASTTQGTPLDVAGGADNGWLPRASMDQLQELASVPRAVYPLELNDGRVLQVMFRVWEQPCLDGQPVHPDADPTPDDPIADITIRLMVL